MDQVRPERKESGSVVQQEFHGKRPSEREKEREYGLDHDSLTGMDRVKGVFNDCKIK